MGNKEFVSWYWGSICLVTPDSVVVEFDELLVEDVLARRSYSLGSCRGREVSGGYWGRGYWVLRSLKPWSGVARDDRYSER